MVGKKSFTPDWLLLILRLNDGFIESLASIVGATEKATGLGVSTVGADTLTSAGVPIFKTLIAGATTLTLTLGASGALGAFGVTLMLGAVGAVILTLIVGVVGALGAFGAVMLKASISICPILGNLIVGASSGLAI